MSRSRLRWGSGEWDIMEEKPPKPVRRPARQEILKSKTTNFVIDDFYKEKIHGLYAISFVDIMSHQKVT